MPLVTTPDPVLFTSLVTELAPHHSFSSSMIERKARNSTVLIAMSTAVGREIESSGIRFNETEEREVLKVVLPVLSP